MTTRRSLVMVGASLTAGRAIGFTASDPATASALSQGMRADVVADTLNAGEAVPGLRAMLVARRGVLVAKRYYAGATAESLQPINSATKSVCSMLVGLALRDGRLKSLPEQSPWCATRSVGRPLPSRRPDGLTTTRWLR